MPVTLLWINKIKTHKTKSQLPNSILAGKTKFSQRSGRLLVIGTFGGGTDGVRQVIENLTGELKQAMNLTGCVSPGDISDDILC